MIVSDVRGRSLSDLAHCLLLVAQLVSHAALVVGATNLGLLGHEGRVVLCLSTECVVRTSSLEMRILHELETVG